jgi:hypothetical protein
MLHNLFSENRAVFDTMSKNLMEPVRQLAIWRMRVACWISKQAHARARARYTYMVRWYNSTSWIFISVILSCLRCAFGIQETKTFRRVSSLRTEARLKSGFAER